MEKINSMEKLTDDEIAAIGSETGLRHLPDYLDADHWNNIEPALFEFARKCIAAAMPGDNGTLYSAGPLFKREK